MGFLELTTGGMGTGKTAHLIVEYNNLIRNDLKVLIIKPLADLRDFSTIRSRILPDTNIKADIILSIRDDVPVERIIEDGYNVVIVDEIQMFSEKQVKQLHYLSVITDISVYLYGLLISCTGDPFPASMLANALADSTIKLKSINKDKEDRNYAIKYSDGIPIDITKTALIEAGGDSLYSAVSKREFYEIYKNYIADSLNIGKQSEIILVAYVGNLEPSEREEVIKNIYTLKQNAIRDIMVNNNYLLYMKRYLAEHNNEYVQLVRMAYFYRRVGDSIEIFGCKRISGSNETRLHNTYTIMFGGHTAKEDNCNTLEETLQTALLRELEEELELPTTLKQTKSAIDVIYTPNEEVNYVSNFHACDVIAFDVTDCDELKIKEVTKLAEGKFYTIEQLKWLDLEGWSGALLESLLTE